MNSISPIDMKALAQDPDFRNLTVEEAIRLLGEREKQNIENERVKVVNELKKRLEEKEVIMKSGR
jgi:hypothetical protein